MEKEVRSMKIVYEKELSETRRLLDETAKEKVSFSDRPTDLVKPLCGITNSSCYTLGSIGRHLIATHCGGLILLPIMNDELNKR